MGAEENKVVVRRFIENVASGRDVSVADDVLAPGYVNLAVPGVDIAGLKAMTAALAAVVGEARTSSLESRGLAYYHLTDGKIDVNDVMMMPDLHEVLGRLMGPPPTDQ